MYGEYVTSYMIREKKFPGDFHCWYIFEWPCLLDAAIGLLSPAFRRVGGSGLGSVRDNNQEIVISFCIRSQ